MLPPVVYYASASNADAVYRMTAKTDAEQSVELKLPLRYREAFPILAVNEPMRITVEWSKENDASRNRVDRVCTPTGSDARSCTIVVPVPKSRDHP